MANVYFIGDTHWGHKNICNFRTQFSSVEEHDEVILDNILSTVGKRDTLWLLGDCFFTEDSLDNLREINKHVRTTHLVLGNHDSDSGVRQNNLRTVLSEGLVSKVGALFKYKGFWLSHAPIHDQELRGHMNIHGHTHDEVIPDDRYVGVSCERVGYVPVSFSRIKEMVQGGKEL
jgi:calcineurin-like phosphoesterase family protein